MKIYSSFDGTNTRIEASTEYRHLNCALGNYKNSPFVTGGHPGPEFQQRHSSGLKTEILDYETGRWVTADDYPFALSNKYV